SVGWTSVRVLLMDLSAIPGEDSSRLAVYEPAASGPRVGSGCRLMLPGVVPLSGAAIIHAALLVAVQGVATLLSSSKLSDCAAIGAPLTAVKAGTPEVSENCVGSTLSLNAMRLLWPSLLETVTWPVWSPTARPALRMLTVKLPGPVPLPWLTRSQASPVVP